MRLLFLYQVQTYVLYFSREEKCPLQSEICAYWKQCSRQIWVIISTLNIEVVRSSELTVHVYDSQFNLLLFVVNGVIVHIYVLFRAFREVITLMCICLHPKNESKTKIWIFAESIQLIFYVKWMQNFAVILEMYVIHQSRLIRSICIQPLHCYYFWYRLLLHICSFDYKVIYSHITA